MEACQQISESLSFTGLGCSISTHRFLACLLLKPLTTMQSVFVHFLYSQHVFWVQSISREKKIHGETVSLDMYTTIVHSAQLPMLFIPSNGRNNDTAEAR